MEYNFREVEKKWQAYWAKNKTFKTENVSSKPKYYVLDMFPYPSGAGLHVGHPLGYIASDIFARYKRLKGFNVLHPMGYDSFGLPAEQYAIQTGQHPRITTENNIARYREQLDKIGLSFDWDREVRTSDQNYYKWTQWIFIQLFNSWYNPETDKAEPIETLIKKVQVSGIKYQVNGIEKTFNELNEKEQSDILLEHRLAFLSDTMVNWCPQLGTVLANEEVKDGVSERGGYPVERKLMKQWSLRITAYANRLLNDLEALDWTESIKEAQRNWIGKSEGTSLRFSLTPSPSPKERGTTPGYHTANKRMWERLKENSKKNRQTQTESEQLLWERVRDSKLGFKIRRQHAIDRFIADFVCLEKKLIIEVDGEIHEHQQEYDEGRTYILEEIGYRVIRFKNNSVKENIDWVCNEIVKALNENVLETPFSFGEGARRADEAFIEVFTTRPDTIFGVSFVTLAPEYELVEKITSSEQKKAVDEYIIFAKNRSERERQADVKKITGVFTGAYAIHPFTGKQLPIWIGDYVLAGYGTGAVMAVPSHDSRDFAFANHFGIEKNVIIQPPVDWDFQNNSYDEKEGKLVNSDFLNGLEVKTAIKKIISVIEERGLGKGKTNFRLRDAIFGRQRYWGEPIPVYYKDGIPQVLNENELPLLLPEVDKYLPTETGKPPLARAKDWRRKPLSNSPHGGENAKPKWQTASDSTWEELKKRSNELRNNPTETEKILWQHLKAKQLDDKFRRQHVIGNNIVDFVCLDKNLVIEVDGKIHEKQINYDEKRTKELESIGFKVIRFTNDEIIGNIDSVVEIIKSALSEVLPIGEDLGGAYEYSTMPGWAGSSWYFLRYMDAHNDKTFVSKAAADYWQNVDLYIGGAEHATGHLLYVRFWTKFLNDLGLIPVAEPAKKLINQGMIQGVSAFVYRIKDTNVFISKNRVDDFLSEEELKKTGLPSQHKIITPLHVDVNIVNNNILDIEAFKNWREEYKNVEFILEDGKYICGSEVEKMSKSKWNVVSPDDIVQQQGADCLRLYEMFLGPLEQSKPWNTSGISGVSNFMRKLWRLYHTADWNVTPLLWRGAGGEVISDEPATRPELKTLHKTIKKITEDIERFSFNTSVSNFMICVNELTELKCNKRSIVEPLAILIAPYAPHIAEELWNKLGHTESITYAEFPVCVEEYLVESSFNYPVSFNGKTRFFKEYDRSLSKEDVEKEVLSLDQTLKYLEGKTPKKVIVVHNKIVNIVI